MPVMIEGREWPRIYCDCCGDIRPVRPAMMEADERNDHAAVDLLCDVCHLVITTLHATAAR